jgi:phage terminase large subunit GpA-like protein
LVLGRRFGFDRHGAVLLGAGEIRVASIDGEGQPEEGAGVLFQQVRGVFVELAPGVDGLVHISELGAGRRIQHPQEVVKVGEAVQATVLGVDKEKRRISLSLDSKKQHLDLPKPENGEPYPNGYLHLPQVSEEFCRQLTAEHLVTKLNNKGYRIHQWEKMRDRNEAMDCHVYSRAGAHQLGVDRFSEREWRRIEAIVLPAGEIPVPAPSPEVEPIPQVPAAIYSQEPAPPPPAYQVQAPRPKAKMPRVFRSNWLGR